eukprot:8248369-Alexandrium_andersonii.AAC.1
MAHARTHATTPASPPRHTSKQMHAGRRSPVCLQDDPAEEQPASSAESGHTDNGLARRANNGTQKQ